MTKSKGKFGGGADRDPGFGMGADDQAFLDQIEQNIRSSKDDKEEARREAEQRAAEMERIRTASAHIRVPNAGVKQQHPTSVSPVEKNPKEDDPRYKEYFDRLRRQKGETPAPTSSTPAQGLSQSSTANAPVKSQSRSVGPGAIVRFDDGSIGIYKDAVSGRDYALFYFLQTDGQFVPQGVFLQCYQARVIGNMPENYFSEMRDRASWDRDLIVFHLHEFGLVNLLNELRDHDERKPKNTTPVKNETVSDVPKSIEQPKLADTVQPSKSLEIEEKPKVVKPTPTGNQGLVKGRQFQIKFGGKQWEAVYWTSDEQGGIVAHSTHGTWSLMRLDLDRFKDSLELGEIVDNETMSAIAAGAA